MAATIETIRKLTFIAADSGLTQLHARLQAVVDAGGDVSQAAQAMAVSTTTAARGSASLEKDLAKLEARFLPTAREAQNLERVTRQLFAGLAQGMDPSRAQAVFDSVIKGTTVEKDKQLQIAKETAAVDRALVEYEEKRAKRAADAVALEERLIAYRRAQAPNFSEVVDATLGVERERKSARDSARVFEEQITREMTEQQVVEKALLDTEQRRARMAQDRASYEERIASMKQQQQGAEFGRSLNERFGLGPEAAAAGKTSRDQFAAQFAEQERLMRFANEMKQASNAAGAAQQRLMKETIDLAHAQQLGAFTAKEFADAQAYLASKAQLSAKGIGLTTNTITQLGFQINDVISGLAMGQSVLTIFAQQTGQIVQVLQGPQGLVQGFKDAGKWLLSLVTPARVAFGAVAAAVVGAAFAYNKFVDQTIEANITVLGLGRSLGVTRDQFIALAEAAGKAGSMSTSAALTIANQLARGTKIGAENIEKLTGSMKDIAATWGLTMEEAGKKMQDAFSSFSGLEKLNKELAFLSGNQLDLIKRFYESNQQAKGAAIALDALRNVTISHTEAQSKSRGAWEMIKTVVDNANMAVGAYITSLLNAEATEKRRASLPKFEPLGEGGRRAVAEREAATGGGTGGGKSASKGGSYDVPIPPEVEIANYKKLRNEALEYSAQLRDMSVAYGLNEQDKRKAADAAEKIRVITANGRRQDLEAVQDLKEKHDATTNYNEVVDVLTQTEKSYNDQRGQYISREQAAARVSELRIQLEDELTTQARKNITEQIALLEQRGVEQTQQMANQKVKEEGLKLDAEAARVRREDINTMTRTRDPLSAIGDQQEINNQTIQKELQYRAQRMSLSAAEIAMFREEIATTVERNRVREQLNKLYTDFVKPSEDFTKMLQAADQLLASGTINANQYADAILNVQIKMEESSKTIGGGFRAGLLSVQRDFADTSKLMQGFVTSSANTLTTSLADMFDGTKTVSQGFKDLSKTVLRSLSEMVIKAMIVAPIFKSLQAILGGGGLNLGSLFGGSSTTAKVAHAGGIIGDIGAQRYIHPAYYENAPRFHNGGLATGEIPAILRRNEEVLTPDNPRHAFNSGGGMLTVNVEGARGNQEIMSMVQAGVQGGLAAYDKGLNGGGLARKMSNVRMRGQR